MAVICWDFDGTLAYAPSIWSKSAYKSLCETMPENKVDYQTLRELMWYIYPWDTPYDENSRVKGEQWWDYMNEKFAESYMKVGIKKDIAIKAMSKIRAMITNPKNYEVYEDAVDTLIETRNRGHKNILLSNNYPDLEQVVKALGIAEYFEYFIVSGVLGYDKPRIQIFNKAFELYPNETEFYMIGDNPHADILGGKNAGMKTILVHRAFDKNADYCCENLSQVLSVLMENS